MWESLRDIEMSFRQTDFVCKNISNIFRREYFSFCVKWCLNCVVTLLLLKSVFLVNLQYLFTTIPLCFVKCSQKRCEMLVVWMHASFFYVQAIRSSNRGSNWENDYVIGGYMSALHHKEWKDVSLKILFN